ARPAARGGPRRVGGGARQAPRNVGCDRRLSRLSQSAVFAFRAFRLRNLHCDRIVLGQELLERRGRLLGARLGLLHPSFGCVLGFDLDPLLIRRRQRVELAELEFVGDRLEDFLELGVALPLEGCDVIGHGSSWDGSDGAGGWPTGLAPFDRAAHPPASYTQISTTMQWQIALGPPAVRGA